MHEVPFAAGERENGFLSSYELIIGVSVAVPAEFADEAAEAAGLLPTMRIELPDRESSNVGPGESEVRLVFRSLHQTPTADRLQTLREGALLAACGRTLDALFERRIPCRIVSWGCTDPQVDAGPNRP